MWNVFNVHLFDYENVRWSGNSPFSLGEVGPEATAEDREHLREMFNFLPNTQKTVKKLLEDEIAQVNPYFLKISLKGENLYNNEQLEYQWTSRNGG